MQRDVLHIKREVLFPDDPSVYIPDSPNSLDSSPYKPALQAVPEVSQVDDSNDAESSQVDDSETNQKDESQILADESERKKLYEELCSYLKKPKILPQVKWYVPGQQKYPEQDVVTKNVYADQMKKLLNSRNPSERRAAMNAILEKLGRKDEIA
jgi:hypothetical protein